MEIIDPPEQETEKSEDKTTFSPPLEPDNVLALAWASLFAFSDDVNKQAVGKTSLQDVRSMMNQYPANSQDRLYLLHLNNHILGSVRSLSSRLDGMASYLKSLNEIAQTKLDQAKSLGNITGDIGSVIPRVGASVGGLSILPLLAKVANFAVPSVGGLSSYDLLLVGAFLGYVLGELLLRLYSFLKIPRILQSAQFERHRRYNIFVREAKEILTALALNAIRLQEQFFPEAGTIGKDRFFYDPNMLQNNESKGRLADYIKDLVDRITPAIHDDICLSRNLRKTSSRFERSFNLKQGDFVLGSYTVEGSKGINVFFIKNEHSRAAKINPSNCEYARIDNLADEFRLFIKEQGSYLLVYENKSRVSAKWVTSSLQVIKGDTPNFLPRQSSS